MALGHEGAETGFREDFVYSDEPLPFSRDDESETPPEIYREMRRLAGDDQPFSRAHAAEVFYRQAKLMEDFEDDYDCDAANRLIARAEPSYQNLTTAELRGYFTWRTRVRRGLIEPAPEVYALLYAYELINLIGVTDAANALQRLIRFSDAFSAFDPSVQKRLQRWAADFAVYYNQPPETVHAFSGAILEDALEIVIDCKDRDDDTLFSALETVSSRSFTRTPAFRKHKDAFTAFVCEAYRRLDAKHVSRTKQHLPEKFYGTFDFHGYTPFAGALFHQPEPHPDTRYFLSECHSFACQDGWWTQGCYHTWRGRNPDIGVFCRAADRVFRKAHALKPALKPKKDEPRTLILLLTETLREQQEAARPKVTFDLSQLDGIRTRADAVGSKLLTTEEKIAESETFDSINEGDCPHEKENAGDRPRENEWDCPPKNNGDCPLSADELAFVRHLLAGTDPRTFLSERHLLASVIAEAINEKLYDIFSDTVIEFDGDCPHIVDDYLEDLKGFLAP